MHPLLLYISVLATASAVWLPLLPRMEPGGPCGEYADTYELDVLDATAGLGIEFESAAFFFKKDGCSLTDTNAAKAKIISGRTGQYWELTADTGSGAGSLHAEYILNGKYIKVGDGSAARAASAAAQDLIDWKPWTNGPDRKGSIQIEDNNCNPWDIDGPSIRQDPNTLPWEPQVTAPMPLEALYSLMKDQVMIIDPTRRHILDGACMEGDCINLVTELYFQSNPNGIDGTQLTDDVFGFLTLVLSYAKVAITRQKNLKPDQSPKQLLSFMPRTEFNTIYGQVKSEIPGDLFTLLDTLACYTTVASKNVLKVELDKTFCSGTVAKPVSKNVLAGASFQNSLGSPASVNIKAWIQGIGAQSPSPDLLTAYDEGIDKSIGGFGTTMEKMYNSQRSVPLFEFRSLNIISTKPIPAANVEGFESFATKADAAVQALHRQFANPPGRKLKRQASGSCSLTAPPTSVLSSSSTTAAPSVSCQYQDGTPEQSEACTCVSGSSTTVVQPMTLSSISIITQSCDYTTWPGDKPAVTSPPASVATNFAGCQVCTIVGPNEDDCSPLPSSLGCTPEKPSTVLTADTSGVAVGTLTGSALYSAITSGLDQVCQVPPNNGATSAYTCTETATATLAPDIIYYEKGVGEAQFKFDGSLTLQVTESSYDSLEWYASNKAILAAMAQNSTQNNCKSEDGIWQSNESEERRTLSLCKVGSNFQLTEFDPTSNGPARELSFNLRFQTNTEGSIVCEFLVDVIEFIGTTIAVETDTEATLPEELKVDQKLLAACESAGIGTKF